ncbi:[FeFe] hydrogenase H-cluster radical SAM maturase HydG [Romboutsia lituseburensis]|uniref:2-iminoacetate synthase n=1 Tax=Romboutsia lituseburensis DSM 797 TaxID=1121325 RepID=A0A1G9MDJ2_9FIRM|nr:[FeFe] hydrogenase H-cluster radical SAM maturase HydG [Romboutsia lituseburensis]CEH34507.1 2-iminoacetate synthase [Romboutsia lituseburensis]SDL72194.1 2-iminoacetate synthase [Romboutsia lituseburensis DSM 797]
MFINHNYIYEILEKTKCPSNDEIKSVLEKAKKRDGLSYEDIAVLLQAEDEKDLNEIYSLAGEIKKDIYGKRIVVFAPLYVSDYCVNNCVYCGYKRDNKFSRRKLTMEEVVQEVKILEQMGHKRLALELGEDPVNATIDYVLECLDTIYKTQNANGEIRRVNVNIAATTVENYKLLNEKGIGTYILFQETYHQPTYEKMHPKSIKGDYNYHLTSFDRAMEAGIDDVGAGVLFGLSDPRFEVLSLMMHNNHLEEKYGVGFHTISVPRLQEASGVNLESYPYLLNDRMFKKIVAILRIALPFTGLILSTRETPAMRKELLKYGVSQISAGSSTGVGGYKEREEGRDIKQFKTNDERSPIEILKELLEDGYIPSYCTACYRKGRTGDRFMQLAKSGNIKYVCEPNAIMTLQEFTLDYGDKELYEKAQQIINSEVENIQREDIKNYTKESLEKMQSGKRDFYI